MSSTIASCLGVLGAMTLLAGAASAQQACWPPGFIPRVSDNAPSSGSPAFGEVHFYLDDSVSMAGFLASPKVPAKPDTAAPWVFNAMLQGIPGIVEKLGGKASFYRLSERDKAKPLSKDDLKRIPRPDFYVAKDTPIPTALEASLARPGNDVTVIASDFFLDDKEIVGDGYFRLKAPLVEAIRNNKAIGLLAVRHSFNGTIFDYPAIPGQPTQYQNATSRPLLFLMIGSDEQVQVLKNRLTSEFVPPSLSQSDVDHFTLFSARKPRFRGLVDREPSSFPKPAFTKFAPTPFLTAVLASDLVPQIVVERREASAPRAVVDFSRDWGPDTLPPARVSHANAKLWWLAKPRAEKCSVKWDPIPIASKHDVVNSARGSNPALNGTITVMPTEAIRNEISNGIYLITGELVVEGRRLGGNGAWFEHPEWGFDPTATADVLARKPTFFPTLNLPRLGRALADIVNESSKPQSVVQFAVGVQLVDKAKK